MDLLGERLTLKETLMRIFPTNQDDGVRKCLYICVRKKWRQLHKKYTEKHGEVVDGNKRRDLPVEIALKYGSKLCLQARKEFLDKCAAYGIHASNEEDPEIMELEDVQVSDTDSDC